MSNPAGFPNPPLGPAMAPPGQPRPQKNNSSCAIILIVIAVVSVPAIGVMAALGIYGFRRYMASAKTAEAKNVIGAISRGAAAAYERKRSATAEAEAPSDLGQLLCGSATAVPSAVPSGMKYQPSTTSGQDYETGDDDGGWRCLKFGMTQPQYYQYLYTRGASVVAPSSPMACRGSCFEAGARGDIDGDGNYAGFSRTGVIDSSGQLRLSTQLYIENEFE